MRAAAFPFLLPAAVDVAGKTPGEIAEHLVRALKANYVRDPQVTVNLTDTVSQLLTVEGQVTKPGQYSGDRAT